MGIFFGLVVGKPLGISLFSFIAVKLGIADKPAGASWLMLLAVACLGGIGFTMSIFVDNLAFDKATHQTFIDMGKIAILMASTVAAIVGAVLISLESKREHRV
jgi:NhaA family Na+:H+ antiporter